MRSAAAAASWRLAATLALALLAAVSLLAAVAGGLLRAGVDWRWLQGTPVVAQAAGAHAALMLSGFLGTVIAVERAVAVRLRWAPASPVAAGLGCVALLSGQFSLGATLGVMAAGVSVAVHGVVLQRQRAPHTVLLLVAACAWLMGNFAFATGHAVADALPWWFTLPVLTIAAERLELTRLTPRHAVAVPLLCVIVGVLLAGAALSPYTAVGGVLFGLALVLLALWLGVFDIARRTVRAQGLPRYMAVCLLAGYAWLAVGGLAWKGMVLGDAGRDLALHALGLGFIFSMVMGHAPVILPALLRVKLHFGLWFYAPLLVLHTSLLLRVLGGPAWPALHRTGAVLNAGALVLFVAMVLFSLVCRHLIGSTEGRAAKRPVQ